MNETLFHLEISGFERFRCPHCRAEGDYRLEIHTPVKIAMMGGVNRLDDSIEYVRCGMCDTIFRSSILEQIGARRPLSKAQREAEQHIAAEPMQIVTLAPAAASEIRRRLLNGSFDADTAVRLSVDLQHPRACMVQFDTLELNDADFMQREGELFIVIDRRELPALRGGTIDYRDGRFALEFVAAIVEQS
jgi:Fe-S cluster assembly iron-binding protein IscA